jgi:hypothetical protein
MFRCGVWMWSYFTYFRHGVGVLLRCPLCLGKGSNLLPCIRQCGFVASVKLCPSDWIRLYTHKNTRKNTYDFIWVGFPYRNSVRICNSNLQAVVRFVLSLPCKTTCCKPDRNSIHVCGSTLPTDPDIHNRLALTDSMKLNADLYLVPRWFSICMDSFMSNFAF